VADFDEGLNLAKVACSATFDQRHACSNTHAVHMSACIYSTCVSPRVVYEGSG